MNVSRICQGAFRGIIKRNLYIENYQKLLINSRRFHQTKTQLRQISTVNTKQLHKEDGWVKQMLKKIPFFNVEKTRLMAAAYFLYENIADRVNYVSFFEELDVPDTFYSWFVITELHIWMISARIMAEGDNGRHLRNFLVEALWNDVGQRIKKLGALSNPSVAREQVKQLSEQLQAALIAYDEGLQSDDTILAGALWRRLYQQGDVDPRSLEILVKYVRKQMRLLDHLSMETLTNAKIDWVLLNR
ncbi:ubiquinol-cytochrome-c reductase complex assembly factor 1 [Tribolium madens]|uniref:ubiquinol-cytochrome-c reductase complex assembly factor 1 n=1 Tax=Tribolium madens TaxID=41895 RepID=UPI001CF73EAB|nr:ubiquinol-cytochrome-c reductase complex assembly factor 1 [Tribolium madens]